MDIAGLCELERRENKGRGVSCVRSVIALLERGDIDSARVAANINHDKIRNYPVLEDAVMVMLWPAGDQPSWWQQ